MEKVLRFLFALFLLLSIIEGIIIGHLRQTPPPSVVEVVFRDTLIDTVRYPLPVPYDSTVLRYINVTVFDTVQISPDSSRIDSMTAKLPITQKCYQDSTYKAYVSGFQPKLDSCIVFPRTLTVTKTLTKYSSPKQKKFGWGPQVGIGITPKGVLPYAGLGFFYKF